MNLDNGPEPAPESTPFPASDSPTINSADGEEPEEFDSWLRQFSAASTAPDDDAPSALETLDVSDRNGSLGESVTDVIRWADLTPDETAETFTRLRTFVHWLVRRYDLKRTTVPPCWFRHGALVEELTALMVAWEASFEEGVSGLGPLGWHERLAMGRTRIETHYRGECQTGHVPSAAPQLDSDEEFEDFLDQLGADEPTKIPT